MNGDDITKEKTDGANSVNGTDSDDFDPLDAYMETLGEEAQTNSETNTLGEILSYNDEVSDETLPPSSSNAVRKPRTGDSCESVSDSEEKPGAKRSIEGIPPVDHSTITYAPFRRDFYVEHGSITALSNSEVTELRKSMNISVTGSQIPKCVCSFAHLNLPEPIVSVIQYHEFSAPTPIQAQAIPCILSGRDVIGIAMTGSGKTLSYVIPAVIHVLGNTSTGLAQVAVICPTRELAIQIEQEIFRFAKKSRDKFTSVALTGGLSKYEQFQTLLKGCDVVVGNPGRMIDLLQMKKGLDLSGITMCILDEADRMFSMGFEAQLRVLVQRIRPDKQILMFSATMPPRIERMAREVMLDPIRVVVGAIGQAASVIDQNVFLVHSEEEKHVWLAATLPGLIAQGGRTLIFVNTKSCGDDIMRRVRQILGNSGQIALGAIHGDMDQSERMKVMNDFKLGRCLVLVATDVAARGIDVPGVACVVEFDAAKNFDTHTHRIGRTGRAGVPGTSWTLLMQHEVRMAAHIVESIEALGQKMVNPDLVALAMKHPPFREAHESKGKKKLSVDAQEVEKWEPLDKHFKKGRTESL
jgi:ATP-dependent RNA helicase DDX42